MKVRTVSLKSDTCLQDFYESLRDTGFAVLADVPLSTRALELAYREWARFFSSEVKHSYKYGENQAGYFPFKSENAKDQKASDLKEFWHYFVEQDNYLPSSIDGTHDAELAGSTELIAIELRNLGYALLSEVQRLLPEDVRSKLSSPLDLMAEDSPQHLFRILHYPPLEDGAEGVRAAAHEDINLLTLLPCATAPGLQVRDNEGNWHEVEAAPGTVIVNAGDMLAEATGGHIRSTTHRVVNPTGPDAKRSRYSMPFFLHARPEVRLSERYTAKEYLEQRLREIGLIK